MVCNGLKKGGISLVYGYRIIFGNTHFGPTFDPLFVPTQPIFKAFWDFRRAKTRHHELKTRQNQLFWHSMWSGTIFEKSLFFLHPVDLVDPPHATWCSPRGLGTGI